MKKCTVNVLLVEADQSDADLIRNALADHGNSAFRVRWVRRIAAALEHLARQQGSTEDPIDVILLDPCLPDAQELDAFTPLFEAAPDALVLVLSSPDNEDAARELVQKGAYDYLGKQYVNVHWLPRALRYVTERKQVEAILRKSEAALFEAKERAQVTLNSIGDAVLATDVSGNVTYLNKIAETMTGWRQEEAIGRPLAEVFRIVDGQTRLIAENPAQTAIQEDRTVGLAADCVLIRRDGFESSIEDSSAPIHNREGQVTGAVIVFHDVSASLAVAQKMAHLARHDVLTGQPNRLLLEERLTQTIAQAQRHRRKVALLYLDLDHFKYINDSLGHAVGDQLLISVAERLQSCVRASDTVCRQGGDEFVILLTEIEQPQDAGQVAGKILAALAPSVVIGSHELHVSISIGISIYPSDGDSVNSIMRSADTAMYHAKSSGRNNYQFFRDDMNNRVNQRLLIEAGLRRALINNEFVLHYQPQIHLQSGAMTGAEALIRWQDPEKGMVYPAEFISIAEECGLIIPIGRWVLREACTRIRAWQDAGLQAVPVAVNVSAIELRHCQFVEGVAAILAEVGLPAHYLKLELTESLLIHDAEASQRTLQALKEMGVRLAIDDFGTGYSSLSYLQRFPIDTLKIDGSFVGGMDTDADNAAIVNAVISMGRNLKHQVVAECIENKKQLMLLKAQHCETGQGYQFSHPLEANQFESLLRHKNQGITQRKQV